MPKLTNDEAVGLSSRFNFADAHTHQSPTAQERAAIFDNIGGLFEEARRGRGPELDRGAFSEFMRASSQLSATGAWFLATYSSSVSLEIVANALKGKRHNIVMPEPTFDNIPDIMRRHGFRAHRISLGENADYFRAAKAALSRLAGVDTVLLLVLPNNPTGHWLTERQFGRLCELCVATNTLLVLDVSFRNFDERCSYDMYRHLAQSGVEYVSLEDTGKLWPTLDVKLSFILASASWRVALNAVHADVLLNVSPFASVLIGAYSRFSAADKFASVRDLVALNRRYLRTLVEHSGKLLRVPFADSRISVELVALDQSQGSSDQVRDMLMMQGIAILGARAFFWHEPDGGNRYIRIALARDHEYFKAGTDALVRVLH